MKWFASVCAVLLACISSVPAASARGPYGSISVAGWKGGAYTDNKTGLFSNCIVNANYRSGINFGIVVSKDLSWLLAFSDKRWHLAANQKFPIVLSFDGRTTFNVDGIAVSDDTVFVPMPDNSSLIRSFRAARIMSAFASGNLFQFRLTGTSVLLPVMVACVKTMNAGGLAAATDFTALHRMASDKSAPPMGPSKSPTAVSSIQPNSPQEGSTELQFEAMQIASSFILKASLDHPTLLSREETPISIVSTGAAWKANNATGFVRIIPPKNDVSGLDVAGTIVGNDAKECKGKFASARNSELVDSEVVFRGMSSCEDSEHSVIAEYFIFPRKKGGYILFSVLTPTKASARQTGPAREEMNAGFRQAAYTSLSK
jgi:hypothetical protein